MSRRGVWQDAHNFRNNNPTPWPANSRPQIAKCWAPPHVQKKQGPYFLWPQARFGSLCPLIYQRTAVLRLTDDQSPPSICLSYPISPPSSSSNLSRRPLPPSHPPCPLTEFPNGVTVPSLKIPVRFPQRSYKWFTNRTSNWTDFHLCTRV